jgi:hypothetical protein
MRLQCLLANELMQSRYAMQPNAPGGGLEVALWCNLLTFAAALRGNGLKS